MSKIMIIQLSLGLLLGGSMGALLGYVGKCSTGACPLTANPVRGMMFGALLGAMFSFSVAPTAPSGAVEGDNQALIHIETVEEFRNLVLQSKQPVIVDFYSKRIVGYNNQAVYANQLESMINETNGPVS